jgi:hypothetical protein
MRLPLLIVLLTLMSPCDRLWAQTDLFVGNWRWVPEESRGLTPNITWKLKFVSENGQLREELESHLQSKSKSGTRKSVGILQFDGQEHPFEVTGETKHSKHTVLWKRIDDHTVEGRINHDDGKEYSTDRFVISPDGRKLTLAMRTYTASGDLLGPRSDGTPSETVLMFVRQ